MAKSQVERIADESAEEEQSESAAAEPSDIARAVSRLKNASFRTANERERVPQPLFWSLFASELQTIKKKKKQQRLLTELFGTSEEP